MKVAVTKRPIFSLALTEAITDANGHFILRDVAPGKYILRAERGGYVNPAPSGVRFKDGGATKTVTVAAGQRVEDANLTLAPGAVIAGRILDLSGQPAVNAMVTAWPAPPNDGKLQRLTQTNDRGEYRITGLEAGRYSVTASQRYSFEALTVDTHFPGKTDKADAAVLEIEEGAVLDGIDFSMQPRQAVVTFNVSGKLISRNSVFSGLRLSDIYLVPKELGKPNVAPTHSNGGLFATAAYYNVKTSDASAFEFEFTEVREGRYELFVETGPEVREDCCDVVGRTSIDVHSDLTGLTIVAGGVDVRGQIALKEGSSGKPTGSVSLALVPEDVRTRTVKPAASGSFTIPAVLPGVWKVLVDGIPSGLAVFDIRQGDDSAVDNGIIVAERATEPVEVILSAAGSIEGIVRDAEGKAIGASDVVLMPIGGNETRSALYRRTSSDGAGQFSVASLAVGEYAVMAFQRGQLPPDVVSGPALAEFAAPYRPQSVAVSVRTGAPALVALAPVRRPDNP